MSDTAGGRHSSDDQVAFYRSAFLWFLPWLVVGVVAIGAILIAIDALGNDPAPESASNRGDGGGAAAAPAHTETSEGEEVDLPDPPDEEPMEPEEEKKKKKNKDESEDVELITDGISVQVLNGTSEDSLDDEWADKLEGLGFEIAAVNPYVSTDKTVVYWSTTEAHDAAEALADKFEWVAEAKPEELSTEVDIHLYLGPDEL